MNRLLSQQPIPISSTYLQPLILLPCNIMKEISSESTSIGLPKPTSTCPILSSIPCTIVPNLILRSRKMPISDHCLPSWSSLSSPHPSPYLLISHPLTSPNITVNLQASSPQALHSNGPTIRKRPSRRPFTEPTSAPAHSSQPPNHKPRARGLIRLGNGYSWK